MSETTAEHLTALNEKYEQSLIVAGEMKLKIESQHNEITGMQAKCQNFSKEIDEVTAEIKKKQHARYHGGTAAADQSEMAELETQLQTLEDGFRAVLRDKFIAQRQLSVYSEDLAECGREISRLTSQMQELATA